MPQWDNVRQAIIQPHTNQYGVAQTGVPDGLASSKWCQKYNWDAADQITRDYGKKDSDPDFAYYSGYFLALSAANALRYGGAALPKPGLVMIDELNPDSYGRMCWFTHWMYALTATPEWTPHLHGKWGIYLPSYAGLIRYDAYWFPISNVLIANGVLGVESYIGTGWYNARYEMGGAEYADRQLKLRFMGYDPSTNPQVANAYGYGYAWLHAQRAGVTAWNNAPSTAKLVPVMKVTDGSYGQDPNSGADLTSAIRMLDRAIWAFKTAGTIWSPPQWQYGENVRASRGGVGSYTWDKTAVYSTIRDGYWADSWVHYLSDGTWSVNVEPRYQVPNPELGPDNPPG